MDGAWEDLGGGVFDDGRPPEPVELPVMRPPGGMPPCPRCGLRETVERIDSQAGPFYCGPAEGVAGCGTVFDGSDGEWRRWRQEREEAIRARARSDWEEAG